jgi:hypothetical protein
MGLEQDSETVGSEYEIGAEKSGRGGRIRTLGPRFWRPML